MRAKRWADLRGGQVPGGPRRFCVSRELCGRDLRAGAQRHGERRVSRGPLLPESVVALVFIPTFCFLITTFSFLKSYSCLYASSLQTKYAR